MVKAVAEGPLPRVAILGSANVGKSTLFNRLIGRRRAITHSTAGVTRDPIEAQVEIDGRRLMLVDTGGYSRRPTEALEEAVSAASLKAAGEADVLLLVVDVERLGEDDEELIRRARSWEAKTILVVNKVDTERREPEAWNLLRLGLERLVPVSAEHGSNIDALCAEITGLLGTASGWRRAAATGTGEIDVEESGTGATGIRETRGEEPAIRVSIMGKPNTGKSTLLNRLMGESRSLVSDLPGTTRDVVEGEFNFEGRRILVLDTAGVRRKSRITTPLESYSVSRAMGSVREAEVVLLVVDAEDGLAEQDKKIASVAVREGRGLVLVLNKWDLIEGNREREREVRERVARLMPGLEFAPVTTISARTGSNVRGMLETVMGVYSELNVRVSTGKLNRSLEEWTTQHPPSARYNVRIRYGTQVSSNPQRFVFFANKRARLPVSYERYLAGRLRRTFGLDRVPITLEIRQKGD